MGAWITPLQWFDMQPCQTFQIKSAEGGSQNCLQFPVQHYDAPYLGAETVRSRSTYRTNHEHSYGKCSHQCMLSEPCVYDSSTCRPKFEQDNEVKVGYLGLYSQLVLSVVLSSNYTCHFFIGRNFFAGLACVWNLVVTEAYQGWQWQAMKWKRFSFRS